jgi:hypothetical protein
MFPNTSVLHILSIPNSMPHFFKHYINLILPF